MGEHKHKTGIKGDAWKKALGKSGASYVHKAELTYFENPAKPVRTSLRKSSDGKAYKVETDGSIRRIP
jgi:hypothetical protein